MVLKLKRDLDLWFYVQCFYKGFIFELVFISVQFNFFLLSSLTWHQRVKTSCLEALIIIPLLLTSDLYCHRTYYNRLWATIANLSQTIFFSLLPAHSTNTISVSLVL